MTLALRETPDGCTLPVRVHPGTKRNAINGVHNGALRVSLTTTPTDGRANAALIEFLADRLNIPRARVTLLNGAASRIKTLRVTGLTQNEVEEKLLSDLA